MKLTLFDKEYFFQKLNIFFTLLFIVTIVIFYFWTVTSNLKPFHFIFNKHPHSYHQLIADGFLHGHLYLQLQPKIELLNLVNPYDPNLNTSYRLHDASLYNNKYFFYFTPLIAILFLIPFKLLTGFYLPDQLLLGFFCSFGFVFSYLTLKKLLSFANIKINLWGNIVSLIVLATATTVPFLMRRTEVYEMCIGLGFCLMMMSLYYFLNCFDIQIKKGRNLFLLWTGLLFGLTVCTRPNQLIAIAVLILAFGLVNLIFLKKSKNLILKEIFIISIPVVAIGLMMMSYNYLRFDSPFEFGIHYQLAGNNQNEGSVMSFRNIMISIPNYLFCKFKFAPLFPYFFITNEPFVQSSFYYNYEPVIGILRTPIFYLIFLLIFFKKIWAKLNLYVWITLSIFSASVASLLVISMTPGVSMRYLIDFTPSLLIIILGCFWVFYANFFNKNRFVKYFTIVLFLGASLFSAMVSIFTSFTGYYDHLKTGNPILYVSVGKKINDLTEVLLTSAFRYIPGNLFSYLLNDGFDVPESWGGIWTIISNAKIKIWATNTLLKNDMIISFDLVPFSPHGIQQILNIYVNHVFYKKVFFKERKIVDLKIPSQSLLEGANQVDFEIKSPKRPSDYLNSGDNRRLGVGLMGIKIHSKLRSNDV